MSQNSRFRAHFENEHGKGTKHCWNLNLTPFATFIDHCEGNWLGGIFVTILAADDKYSLLKRDNLRQPIQMQLSQKQKRFSEFVSGPLKSGLRLQYFQQKMILISDVFSKLQTHKNVVK